MSPQVDRHGLAPAAQRELRRRSRRPRAAMPSRPPRLDTLTITPAVTLEHPGEQRPGSCATGDVKLTRIASSTSSSVSSLHVPALRDGRVVARPRRGGRSASHASSASALGGVEVGQVDATHMPAVGRAAARQRSSTSSSRSARRATMPTVAPRSASIGASAAPMPDDAPVTSTRAPSRSSGWVSAGTRGRYLRRAASTGRRARRTRRDLPGHARRQKRSARRPAGSRWHSRSRSGSTSARHR